MNRQEYLTFHWKSYPAMPNQVLAAGRLRKIEKQEKALTFWIERSSAIKDYSVPINELAEVLIEGDIIAILPDLSIQLLVPFQGLGVLDSFPQQMMTRWREYVDFIRLFFKDQNFLELKTPTLVPCPGTEPSLDVFATELKLGSKTQKLYLPTSPELHLKKALVKGAEKIFEFAPCFRNGEKTVRHRPEFIMLEWYRAYSDLQAIQQDVIALVMKLAESLQLAPPSRVLKFTVADLFLQYCGFTLTPQTSLEDLKNLAFELRVDVSSASSIDDFFFLIFTEKIEEKLPRNEMIIVEKYPPYQAALARLTEDGWGNRFEVYWKGLELANAFDELNDPKVQRLRSKEDLEKKKQMQKEAVALDEDFFKHLDAGMPPSAGIALGVERLFMALYDLQDIEELQLFSSSQF